ncbi:WD repeat-containing protein 74 [Coturnix japonica]|uniref:WD repeat-containing protein 74 n=1 Tax=Coturnix japonica TaxID=93934 RepID=UPI0007778033|nr:WD repeat-containing protein 74 [Coturnix japonica]
MAATARQFHVWVGAESGALKAVNLKRKEALNFGVGRDLGREAAIKVIAWSGEQKQVLLGRSDRSVQRLDLGTGSLSCSRFCPNGDGDFCGIAAYGSPVVLQVRLYDSATPRRRPVLQVSYGEGPLTALALVPGGTSVVVGSARGEMAVIDMRQGRLLRSLRGCAGSIRSLQCHPSLPVVASCGLDRFLRVHSLQDKSIMHKVYLKSRLNCLLLSSCQDLLAEDSPPPTIKEEEEEGDELWGNMETIPTQEPPPKRRRKDPQPDP